MSIAKQIRTLDIIRTNFGCVNGTDRKQNYKIAKKNRLERFDVIRGTFKVYSGVPTNDRQPTRWL